MENNGKIKVVDSPMGSGKTTILIETVTNDYHIFGGMNKRFIILTPFVNEVTRITEKLRANGVDVVQPVGVKTKEFIDLINRGKNVVATHEVFRRVGVGVASFIDKLPYTYDLFIDEEPPILAGIFDNGVNEYEDISTKTCVDKYETILPTYSLADFQYSKDTLELFTVSDKNVIEWNETHKAKSHFEDLQKFFVKNRVYKLDKQDNLCFIAFMQPHIWKQFNSVTVLSYRVPYSYFAAYCQMFDIDIEYYHIEGNKFAKGYLQLYPRGLERLCVSLSHLNKLEDIRMKRDNECSSSWYNRELKKLRGGNADNGIKTIYSYVCSCSRGMGGVSNNIWCTFKSAIDCIKNNNGCSAKNHLSCNIKGTNDYIDTTNVVYTINRYLNPMVTGFFRKHNVTINEEEWALNELLQFIWRSNIRDVNSTQKVTLHIASNRMRRLLSEWLAQALRAENVA